MRLLPAIRGRSGGAVLGAGPLGGSVVLMRCGSLARVKRSCRATPPSARLGEGDPQRPTRALQVYPNRTFGSNPRTVLAGFCAVKPTTCSVCCDAVLLGLAMSSCAIPFLTNSNDGRMLCPCSTLPRGKR